MSHCDNMLLSGSCGISLLQQLWGISKNIKCCGCCSGSRTHFAIECLCSLIVLAHLLEECKKEQECSLWTLYTSVKVPEISWDEEKVVVVFLVQELFPRLAVQDLTASYGEGRCPSQRKTSNIMFLEVFSDEEVTKFHSIYI